MPAEAPAPELPDRGDPLFDPAELEIIEDNRDSGHILMDRVIYFGDSPGGNVLSPDEQQQLEDYAQNLFPDVSKDEAFGLFKDQRQQQLYSDEGGELGERGEPELEALSDTELASLNPKLRKQYQKALKGYADAKVSNLNGTRGERKLAKSEAKYLEASAKVVEALKNQTGESEEIIAKRLAIRGASEVSDREYHKLAESRTSKGLNWYAKKGLIGKVGFGVFMGAAGVLTGGATIVAGRFIKNYINKRSAEYRDPKEVLKEEFEAKKTEARNKIQSSDKSSFKDLHNEGKAVNFENAGKAVEHKKRGRKAIAIGIGAIVVGRAAALAANSDTVREFFAHHKIFGQDWLDNKAPERPDANGGSGGDSAGTADEFTAGDTDGTTPLDLADRDEVFGESEIPSNQLIDGIPAEPGETYDNYFNRVYTQEWSAHDRYNFGKLVEWGENNGDAWQAAHPDTNIEDALGKISNNIESNPAEQARIAEFGDNINALEQITGGPDSGSMAELSQLQQSFIDGEIDNGQLNDRFAKLLDTAPSDDQREQFGQYLYDHRNSLLTDSDLRTKYANWWRVNR